MSRTGSEAQERVDEARHRLRQAQVNLLHASELLDATTGVRWGQLPEEIKRERRLIIHGAHLAWAKIDATFRKLAAGGRPGGLADDRQQHDQGDELGQQGIAYEHEADSHEGDAAGLAAARGKAYGANARVM